MSLIRRSGAIAGAARRRSLGEAARVGRRRERLGLGRRPVPQPDGDCWVRKLGLKDLFFQSKINKLEVSS